MDADTLRRWWRDHAEIDRALDEIRIDLARGDPAAGDARFARFATALERHFATEEEIYFPLAARTSAQSARLLDRVRLGHQRLRGAVEDLRRRVELAQVASARRAFAMLLDDLHAHEKEEVEILVELERLVDATAVP
jgi:iron-sulfur cluster repair protein YtfE (RIC family)